MKTCHHTLYLYYYKNHKVVGDTSNFIFNDVRFTCTQKLTYS